MILSVGIQNFQLFALFRASLLQFDSIQKQQIEIRIGYFSNNVYYSIHLTISFKVKQNVFLLTVILLVPKLRTIEYLSFNFSEKMQDHWQLKQTLIFHLL